MIKHIQAANRFHAESDWLSAYWLFSFDRYYDPNNMRFGPLRVFNHDTIKPASGFPPHSHREMEIITYMLDGELTHQDSTGNQGIIRAGEVQRMTAGTGITHSEINSSLDTPATLLQMWVFPREKELAPSYEQKRFIAGDRVGRLCAIASGQGIGDGVKVHQDVTFYVSTLHPGNHLSHILAPGRRGFLYVIDGEIALNGEQLETGDQARLMDIERLEIVAAVRQSEIILIDLP